MTSFDLPRRITYWRERAGISKAELARAVGVVPSNVTLWETGGQGLSIRRLHKVADVLGVSMSEFWGPIPEPEDETTETETAEHDRGDCGSKRSY